MSTRLIASFLAFVVFWSGFASWEAEPSLAETASVVALPDSAVHDGSVADHHLDDQPVQSPSDVGGGFAVLPALGQPVVLAGSHEMPPSASHRVPDTPFVEGLRRPPRRA